MDSGQSLPGSGLCLSLAFFQQMGLGDDVLSGDTGDMFGTAGAGSRLSCKGRILGNRVALVFPNGEKTRELCSPWVIPDLAHPANMGANFLLGLGGRVDFTAKSVILPELDIRAPFIEGPKPAICLLYTSPSPRD